MPLLVRANIGRCLKYKLNKFVNNGNAMIILLSDVGKLVQLQVNLHYYKLKLQ